MVARPLLAVEYQRVANDRGGIVALCEQLGAPALECEVLSAARAVCGGGRWRGRQTCPATKQGEEHLPPYEPVDAEPAGAHQKNMIATARNKSASSFSA